ncbi:TauD/TfdA family dioxygenase [Marinomonas sp. 2405UD66-6]|uniref:TauD/TfdA family dioxygenase n=1 Tax=Marinomonas sp. 2405UD66-6 TaxID=3391834 RepID=UPI0039C9E7D7
MNMFDTQTEIASFTPYSIEQLPLSITLHDESLSIVWDDDHESEYHFLWLRDNCHCSECVSMLTREQVFEICDVPYTIKPSHAYITDDHRLVVEWNHEGHISKYHPGWLREHCYSKSTVEANQWKPRLWDKSSIATELPKSTFDEITQSDTQLLIWLRQLRDYGVALITKTNQAPNDLVEVANKISFIRKTNFGTIFNVKAKADANSSAYTDLRLPLHTDLPTRELQPGLQFLHCLINDASGGESILVDGFKIARYMQENHPEEFDTLRTVPMPFHNKDRQSDYRFRSTVIMTDSHGEIVEVRLANFLRGSFDVPACQTLALYRAYRCFIKLTREPRFQFFYRLKAGDLMVFDNRRVLHARNAFDLTSGSRHLQGCYVDRDELLSRIRVLERHEN